MRTTTTGRKKPKGCGCVGIFTLGFAVWMILVIGPWFPTKYLPPYSVNIVGSHNGVLGLATGEKRTELTFHLYDKRGRYMGEPVLKKLQTKDAKRLRILGKSGVEALKAGETALSVEVSIRIKGQKKPLVVEAELKVWIAEWHFAGTFPFIGKESKHASQEDTEARTRLHRKNRVFPHCKWFHWKGKDIAICGMCRRSSLSSCQNVLFAIREKQGWVVQNRFLEKALQKQKILVKQICCQVGEKAYFVGRDTQGRFWLHMLSLDLEGKKWTLHSKLPKAQRNATMLSYSLGKPLPLSPLKSKRPAASRPAQDPPSSMPVKMTRWERVILLGGAGRFSHFGGRRIQTYKPKKDRWEPFSKKHLLPDHSWADDAGVAIGEKIYILNRKGRLWSYHPATKRWEQRTPAPMGKHHNLNGLEPRLAALDGHLFLIWTHPEEMKPAVWSYSPALNRWKLVYYLPYGFLPGADLRGRDGYLWVMGVPVGAREEEAVKILRSPAHLLGARKVQKKQKVNK